MNIIFFVLSAFWTMQFSVVAQENMKSEIPFSYPDSGGQQMNQSAVYRRILVKYDTLIENGAVVFSKPGVDTYNTIAVDAVQRQDGNEGIYVGARNWVFKLDMGLNENEAVEVAPSADEMSRCQREKPLEDCHNFVKYITVDTNLTGKVVVCGTYAYSPACSSRLPTMLSKEVERIPGLSPGDPREGIGAYLSGDKLFSGFKDVNELMKHTILATEFKKGAPVLRTYETKYWLFRAEFVGAFSPSKDDKFVYIVFREIAAEAVQDEVVSRVARICKDDHGGPWEGGERYFSSYTKARLYCGDQHNEVQAISYVEKDPYFWATFADPNNGTAICRFSIENLESAFRGPYLVHGDDGKWEVCPPPHLMEGEATVNTCFGFRTPGAVRAYTLMSEKVTDDCRRPHFVADAALHKIAVSSEEQGKVTAFVSDDKGRIWKIGFSECEVSGDVHLWEAVPANQSIKEINGLVVHNDSIIVLTHDNILKILTEKDYPGEIIDEPTTAFTSFTSSSIPQNSRSSRGQPTKPNARTDLTTTRKTNTSHARIAGSRFHITMILIATKVMCS